MARLFFLTLFLLTSMAQAATDTFTAAGSHTWTAPSGVTSVTVETWGGGGGGGAATGNPAKGGGGAGAQYARKVVAVTPGNIYTVIVGSGGSGGNNAAGSTGGDSTFAATTVVAKGGAGGGLASANNSGGTAGAGSTASGIGDTVNAGGNGSAGAASAGICNDGGAGGGGAGSGGAGGNANGNTAGAGKATGGGNGGTGLAARGTGNAGAAAGGGGGGACADTGQDQNGGAGAAGRVDITYTVPTTVNSINCVGTCLTNAATVSWTVTFNNSVAGLSASNFTLVPTGLGGTPAITSVTGSGATWTVAASTGTGDGTLGLNMTSNTVINPAVTNLPYTGQVFTLDRTAPAASSIARLDPSPTGQTSVSWAVSFTEAVTGVDITDFVLAQTGGANGAAITTVTGSGASWTVTASTGISNGSLRLDLVDDDSILDATGNPLGGLGAGNGNFAGENYAINFTAPSFVFTNSACISGIAFGAPGQACALISWSPQIAGQNLAGIYLTAVNTSGVPFRIHPTLARTINMQFGLSCHNPVANAGVQATFAALTLPLCQPDGGTPASWSAAMPVNFNAGSPSSAASYTFNYADVGMVELWMRNSDATMQVGYSSPFVVKPAGFVLSGIQQTATPNLANPAANDATGAKFVKAGEAFSITVTAVTTGGAATPNYGKESPAESVKLTSTLAGGLGLTNNPSITGAFSAFNNGAATGTAFTWNEVGIITLTPSVSDGNYLGAGDVTGTTTGRIGRFHAAQFALSGGYIANRTGLGGACALAGCDTFTYMGEQMSALFTLTAKAADGTTTLQNYNYSATAANNFAKLNPAAAGNPLALAAVDTGTPRTVATLDTSTYGAASGSFVNGEAAVTAPFAVTRDASPSGPFDALDIGVAPVDGDGAALGALDLAVNTSGTPNTHGKLGSTKARFGRLKIASAHGSELLLLPITVTAQYWNGSSYLANALDNSSKFAPADVLLSNYQKNLAAGETSVMTPPASITFANGIAGYRLSKPGAGNNGSVDMEVNVLSSYLPGNKARATFGVYKGSNEIIFIRENY